jgi:glucose/arabinose dehydrogenase
MGLLLLALENLNIVFITRTTLGNIIGNTRLVIIVVVLIIFGTVMDKKSVGIAATPAENYEAQSCNGPKVLDDPNLRLVPIFQGLRLPVAMAFLGQGDILIGLEPSGIIHRIINGNVLPDALLDVQVANGGERGLLGLAASRNESRGLTYVFIFYTKSGGGKDGDDVIYVGKNITRGITPYGSVLERYELINNRLVNPKLLLYINSTPTTQYLNVRTEMHHVGGKVVVGPDKNVYVITGDSQNHKTQAQNYVSGVLPNGTGGIIRITQDGQSVKDSPLGTQVPWIYYYAYGIRNGFGLDFDPLTGKLWDTEAGYLAGDEINLVEPGFNSGWDKLQGFAKRQPHKSPSDLVYPDGGGIYQDPVFDWSFAVTPTAIKFFNSDKLGKKYENDLFVSRYNLGPVNQSYLYHFDLNLDRSGFLLNGSLEDKMADNLVEDKELAFAACLGVITDLQVGPDGYLYLLEHFRDSKPQLGTIYRLEYIIPFIPFIPFNH